MNPFLNPKKRSINLPEGAKNLMDVLEMEAAKKNQCLSCGSSDLAPLVPGGAIDQSCKVCRRDFQDFMSTVEIRDMMDFEGFQRRMDNFMRPRISARKPKDSA